MPAGGEKKRRQYKCGIKKAALTQDGHPEVGGYGWDPRVHMKCPFRGRVFTFFSSVPVTGTQFPVPPGMVWREPALDWNVILCWDVVLPKSIAETLDFGSVIPLFWTHHFACKEQQTKDVMLNSDGLSFILFPPCALRNTQTEKQIEVVNKFLFFC